MRAGVRRLAVHIHQAVQVDLALVAPLHFRPARVDVDVLRAALAGFQNPGQGMLAIPGDRHQAGAGLGFGLVVELVVEPSLPAFDIHARQDGRGAIPTFRVAVVLALGHLADQIRPRFGFCQVCLDGQQAGLPVQGGRRPPVGSGAPKVNQFVAGGERKIGVRGVRAAVQQSPEAAIFMLFGGAGRPINARFRDVRASDGDPHPLAGFQGRFGQAHLVDVQHHPGRKMAGLHPRDLPRQAEQGDLAHIQHPSGERPLAIVWVIGQRLGFHEGHLDVLGERVAAGFALAGVPGQLVLAGLGQQDFIACDGRAAVDGIGDGYLRVIRVSARPGRTGEPASRVQVALDGDIQEQAGGVARFGLRHDRPGHSGGDQPGQGDDSQRGEKEWEGTSHECL